MMPQMQSTIFGFEETIQFQLIKKTVVDHDLVESNKIRVPLFFEGSLQSIHPRQLMIKPEGERAWKWRVLYTDFEMDLETVIEDSTGIQYRVMTKSDWNQAGYFMYELIEGPTS